MPFADRFTEVYEQVYRPCCHSLDVRCWRVDEVAGPGSITTDIINGVLDSTFLIADLTTQNPNVFYELGIAHTLGKEVILTCQSVEDVPFDIRSSRVIIYDQTISGAAKLRHALARAIESVLQGSEAASKVGRRSWKKLPDAPRGEYVAARLNVREEIGMNDGARDGPCWLPAASARGSARS
jgi:hypothetical protein